MNQTTNLIQWKNLTQEQMDDFDFENYKYEFQGFLDWNTHAGIPKRSRVYQLVIEYDKWYTYSTKNLIGEIIKTVKGSEFVNPEEACECRPARPDEIPQQEKTLEQKIQNKWFDKKVVILSSENGMLRIVKTIEECEYDSPHVNAQSMKGFYKYVYEQDNDLIASLKTLKSWKGKTIQPVAVLFERSEG